MKGSVGTTTSIYHTRLPNRRSLRRMARCLDLSKEAKTRLSMIGHYKKHENASVTSRRFGISRTTFYKRLKRYLKRGLRGLENLPRTPKRRRTSNIPWQTVQLVCDLCREHPAWSRHEMAVILKRDYGVHLSSSSVGRILKRKGLYDKRAAGRRKEATISLEACSSRFDIAFLLSLVISGGRLFDCSVSCPELCRHNFFYATAGFSSPFPFYLI